MAETDLERDELLAELYGEDNSDLEVLQERWDGLSDDAQDAALLFLAAAVESQRDVTSALDLLRTNNVPSDDSLFQSSAEVEAAQQASGRLRSRLARGIEHLASWNEDLQHRREVLVVIHKSQRGAFIRNAEAIEEAQRISDQRYRELTDELQRMGVSSQVSADAGRQQRLLDIMRMKDLELVVSIVKDLDELFQALLDHLETQRHLVGALIVRLKVIKWIFKFEREVLRVGVSLALLTIVGGALIGSVDGLPLVFGVVLTIVIWAAGEYLVIPRLNALVRRRELAYVERSAHALRIATQAQMVLLLTAVGIGQTS